MPQRQNRPETSDSDDIVGGSEHARPYGTLASIAWWLKDFTPPHGEFDPHGPWRLTYALWLEDAKSTAGYLEIVRSLAGGSIELDFRMAVTQTTGAVHHTKGNQRCAPDDLCTPRSWTLESWIADSAGQPIPETRMAQSSRQRARKPPARFTSNWSLFDAVQRAASWRAPIQQFALLEDLDLIKPNQRLAFLEKTSVAAAAGRQLALEGYEQIGDGVLPFHYWLDSSRRLLFVLSGTRAFLYDPQARTRMEQKA